MSRVDRELLDAAALVKPCPGGERVRVLGRAAAQAVALLALTEGQDGELAEGSHGTDSRRKIARNVAEDLMISPVDPGTRHLARP